MFRHFLNKDFKLESFLLSLEDLSEKHSGAYIYKVLLKSLKGFNIEYNINRYLTFILNIYLLTYLL